jgi:peptide/nickel transport system substrate-binding protein
MRFKPAGGFLLALLLVMSLGACTVAPEPEKKEAAAPTQTKGGRATVLEVNAFSSFNPASASGNTDINNKIAHATRSGFSYVSNELKIVRNDKFGSYQKLSDSPLTVKYTVNEGVKWSDGEPIDAGDLLLAWAARSGFYDDDVPGEGGTRYFTPANATSGLALTEFPELDRDGRSMTIKYSRPYVDWELALSIDQPAHVVAAKAGLRSKKALIELLKNTKKGDREAPRAVNTALRAVADYWNAGFNATSLPADPTVFLSSGPYIVRDIIPGESVELVRNKDYYWGPESMLDEISVRTTPSTSAQVDALLTGTADIISPQVAASDVAPLEILSSSSYELQRYDQSGYEHLDLSFNGPFKDKAVREAFLKTVPRKEIVQQLVGPLDPDAKPLDSQFFAPKHPAYAKTAENNGSAAYREVDLDGARRLLRESTPEVRILYNADNANRVAAFRLIRDSAEKAGFKIVDRGLPGSEWNRSLSGGGFDAAIFGWTIPEPAAAVVPQIYGSGQASNYNGYSDKDSDALIEELQRATDPGKRDQLLADLDKRLWDAAYGLPLYRGVGISSHSAGIDGVIPSQTIHGVWWNFWEWRRK